MLTLQNNCQEIETKCMSASSVSEIENEVEAIIHSIYNHKLILQQEYNRLNKFNTQIP